MPQCLASIKSSVFNFLIARGRGVGGCIKTYGLSHTVQQTLAVPLPHPECLDGAHGAEGHLGEDTASALWPRDFHQEVVAAPKMGAGGSEGLA